MPPVLSRRAPRSKRVFLGAKVKQIQWQAMGEAMAPAKLVDDVGRFAAPALQGAKSVLSLTTKSTTGLLDAGGKAVGDALGDTGKVVGSVVGDASKAVVDVGGKAMEVAVLSPVGKAVEVSTGAVGASIDAVGQGFNLVRRATQSTLDALPSPLSPMKKTPKNPDADADGSSKWA